LLKKTETAEPPSPASLSVRASGREPQLIHLSECLQRPGQISRPPAPDSRIPPLACHRLALTNKKKGPIPRGIGPLLPHPRGISQSSRQVSWLAGLLTRCAFPSALQANSGLLQLSSPHTVAGQRPLLRTSLHRLRSSNLCQSLLLRLLATLRSIILSISHRMSKEPSSRGTTTPALAEPLKKGTHAQGFLPPPQPNVA